MGSNRTIQADPRTGLLSRHTLAGALAVVAIVGVAAVLLSAGGHSAPERATKAGAATGASTSQAIGATTAAGHAGTTGGAGHAGTAAGDQVAKTGGHGGTSAARAGTSATGTATVGAGRAAVVAEVRDPEEAKSFPLPASVHHRAASTPSVAAEAAVAPGAASDAEIRKELGEEAHAKAQERAAQQRVLTPVTGGFSVGGNGTIPIPAGIPETVQRVIAGGNAIADFPYIWGGGHGSFVANGYDCSGSVSYALAAGGLLGAPLVSGDLASWGEPGPGRWITIYANAGHTFMNVDGVWFDTAGRSGPYASRWLVATPSLAGYAVRHPPGL
jgi:cell wall-associated NlpC family hydrolase